jgi:hypothetical protein
VNPVREHLALLARHEGIWEGEYTHLAPDCSVQDRHLFRILVEIPATGAAHYRQSSHYWWPDGRSRQLAYEGRYRDGRVHIDDGRIRGACWAVDDETLYITFGFEDDPGGHVCEMIQLSPDGLHRARTWHWLRGHALWRITLVREHRVAGGAQRFQALASTPPALPWKE